MIVGRPSLTRCNGIDPIDPVTSSAIIIPTEFGCSAESLDSRISTPFGFIALLRFLEKISVEDLL